MQPMSSALSGVICRSSEAVENPIGTERSETGSGSLLPAGEQLVARLVKASPPDNDAAVLASLTQRHGVTLKPIRTWLYPTGKPSYARLDGYEVEIAEGGSVEAARGVIRSALRPADPGTLNGWLAAMSVKCAMRDQTEFSARLTLEVYERELSAYPADVAKAALDQWSRENKWWPTWSELYELCEAMTRPRRLMQWTLDRKP